MRLIVVLCCSACVAPQRQPPSLPAAEPVAAGEVSAARKPAAVEPVVAKPWAPPPPEAIVEPAAPDPTICHDRVSLSRDWDAYRHATLANVAASHHLVLLVSGFAMSPPGGDVLVVGRSDGGTPWVQPHVMDANHVVHLLAVTYRVRKRVALRECTCPPPWIGARQPSYTEFVSVPAGATLGAPISLVVPLAADIELATEQRCPPAP